MKAIKVLLIHLPFEFAYYNFLRPHTYNYWRSLNELDELKSVETMPAKWQILISLGQQNILNMQEAKTS